MSPAARPPLARSSRAAIGVAVVLGLLALGVGLSFLRTDHGFDAPALPTGPAGPCPYGYVDRPSQGDAIRAGLAELEETRELMTRLGTTEVRFCFGPIDVPVLADGRVLLVDERVSEAEQAARSAHLLHHLVVGAPFPETIPRDADCDAVVARAIDAEARAYVLEIRLRRRFELPEPRYEMEPAFWAAAEGEREALVRDYLLAHPDGAPNLEPLASGYRQRCEVERARAGRGR